MTPEEQRILLSILNQTSGQTYSGLPKGVTTAGLNRQFDPRSLFLGGGVSTETIDQGIADTYAGLMDVYNRKVAGPNAYQASDAFLGAIPSRWTGTDAVSIWMGEQFADILQGYSTADSIKAGIGKAPKEVQDAVKNNTAAIYSNLEDFAKTATVYNNAVAEQDYNRGQNAITVGPAPTMADARTEYYTKAGAPEMALLPDPNAAYQFDPSTFIDKSTGQYADIQRNLSNDQATLARMLNTAQGSSAIQNNKLAESYRMKALQAEALKYAQGQTSGMKTSQGWWDAAKDIFNDVPVAIGIGAAGGAGLGALPIPFSPLTAPVGAAGGGAAVGGMAVGQGIGDWLSGDSNQKLRDAKSAATQSAYLQQLAKLQSGYTPLTDEQALLRYSPDAALINSRIETSNKNISDMDTRAKLLSLLVSTKLSAAGRSPYADAVNAALRKS